VIYNGGLKAIQFNSIGRLGKKVHDPVNSNVQILMEVQSKIFHDSPVSSNGKSLFGITCPLQQEDVWLAAEENNEEYREFCFQ